MPFLATNTMIKQTTQDKLWKAWESYYGFFLASFFLFYVAAGLVSN